MDWIGEFTRVANRDTRLKHQRLYQQSLTSDQSWFFWAKLGQFEVVNCNITPIEQIQKRFRCEEGYRRRCLRASKIYFLSTLGKDGVSKTDEFSEKFQKRGGDSFQSKNLCCRFWTLNRAFSAWKWYKRVFLGYVFNQFNGNTMLNCCTTCISWEIGSYNTQQSRHTEHTHFCRNFVAKSATWFSENEGGGDKGRLELFQKFISFGGTILPLINKEKFLLMEFDHRYYRLNIFLDYIDSISNWEL